MHHWDIEKVSSVEGFVPGVIVYWKCPSSESIRESHYSHDFHSVCNPQDRSVWIAIALATTPTLLAQIKAGNMYNLSAKIFYAMRGLRARGYTSDHAHLILTTTSITSCKILFYCTEAMSTEGCSLAQ